MNRSGAAELPARAEKPRVQRLFEDDAKWLLSQLTNPTGDPGEGHVESRQIFSGSKSIKIIPMQRFYPGLPGWKFRIRKKPKPGEFRYLRFAWKADGCDGIMIQFHDRAGWNLRYTAGVDRFNWGTKFVAPAPPGDWTVVTCDLFKDFGERAIQGIALTAFGGDAAYFDHIYLARSVDDLDRIDATGVAGLPPRNLDDQTLEKLWKELPSHDAARSYLAFWRLVASPEQSIPFMKAKLTKVPEMPAENQVRQWIQQLHDDNVVKRQQAYKHLARHAKSLRPQLELALKQAGSAEVRARLRRLLMMRRSPELERKRIQLVIRVLEYRESPAAFQCLIELALGTAGSNWVPPAQAAIRRLAIRILRQAGR